MMITFIGRLCEVLSDEHPCLNGQICRVVALLKNSTPEAERAGLPYERLDTEDAISAAGISGLFDRVEVAPWIEKEGRFSWVTSDPRSTCVCWLPINATVQP